jgi:DNA-binding transcriptional ArsR family regulator
MRTDLNPTLWRTCRTLANRMRLRVLAEVLKTECISVTEAAHRCGVSVADASQRLRQLQSRGLLTADRQGRWVFYRAQPNPCVRHADALLRAMRQALQTDAGIADDAMRALTAFTHPRRIALAGALAAGHGHTSDLRAACGLSLPALRRHMRKLRRRGLVVHNAGRYHLIGPPTPLAKVLLACAIATS